MRTLLLLLALLAASPARAERRYVLSPLPPGAQGYSTLDEAAFAALGAAMPLSGTYEHGGALLASRGLFYFTRPVNSRNTLRVDFRPEIPDGYELAAIYHTHPNGPMGVDSQLFSPGDVSQARAHGVPSYIGVLRDGSVRLFDSDTMRTQMNSDPRQRGRTARGVVLGRLSRR